MTGLPTARFLQCRSSRPILTYFGPFARSVRCSFFIAEKPNFLGKVSKAQGCDSSALPTHTWLAALKSAVSRDAVIVHWGSFVSRDLPLYAASPRLQIPRKFKCIAPGSENQAGCHGCDRRATLDYRVLR